MDKSAEHIIIEGCINQERKAQERLYRSYYKAMMNICLRYTQNETEALSVLNISFYKVFKSIQQYDSSKAELYTWMSRIVINCCLDFIKVKNNANISAVAIEEASSVMIEPTVVDNLEVQSLIRLVHMLPPATKAVFNLYVMEGYNHKEIGELLAISEGTSKWHLNDARKKLQILINKSITA